MEHELYLTTGEHPRKPGKLLAVCSRGQPQLGDKNVEILTVEVVSSQKEAREWFARVAIEQPWLKRN